MGGGLRDTATRDVVTCHLPWQISEVCVHYSFNLSRTAVRKMESVNWSVCCRLSLLISRKGKEDMETIHFPVLPQVFSVSIVACQGETARADL